MAKAHIPEGVSVEDAAAELAKLGITLGQRLADGSYRVYVRKNKQQLFINQLNIIYYGTSKMGKRYRVCIGPFE